MQSHDKTTTVRDGRQNYHYAFNYQRGQQNNKRLLVSKFRKKYKTALKTSSLMKLLECYTQTVEQKLKGDQNTGEKLVNS